MENLTDSQIVERIAERCALSNVPFKFNATMTPGRKYLVIACIDSIPHYYSPESFYILYGGNLIKRYSCVMIDDMLL